MITDEQREAVDGIDGAVIAPDSKGADFLIVDGWDVAREVENVLNPNKSVSPESYDTPSIDTVFNDNWGFSDEYAVCDDCGTVIRTSPDSYSWKPDFWVSDGEIRCGDCVRDNPADYIASLLDNPESANTILSDDELKENGFAKVNPDSYENGWYDKQDEPKDILATAQDKEPDSEFLFSVSGEGQFYTKFDLWKRSK